MNYFNALKDALTNIDQSISITTQKGSFNTTPIYKDAHLVGVEVDNLGSTYSFIPLEVFVATLSLLYLSDNHIAKNGNAMISKLGDEDLPLDSIEGHIANVIYGKNIGEAVFRRITPISKILEWANICEIQKSCLKLK